MFTGIIEEIGTIDRRESTGGGFRFRIEGPHSAKELRIHDSVSINGVCHTVVWRDDHFFDVESVEETLRKTSIGSLARGKKVNLELPMRLNERLGGHLVLGHVDTTGTIQRIESRDSSWWITIAIPLEFRRYIIPVGSIAVDGVSLTIAAEQNDTFTVSIIPHTMENTIFQWYRQGDMVNLEFDMVGKYIERMVSGGGTLSARKGFLKETELKDQGY